MKDLEVNIRVCNKLLNRVMKNDYGYDDCLFRIDPIYYMNNRNRGYIPRKFHTSEEVVIKCKNNPDKIDKFKMKKELTKTINFLLNFIEGRDFRKVLLIYFKIIK
jgi:hypothetical protein